MMIRKPSTFKSRRSNNTNIHSVICKGIDEEYNYFFKEQTQSPNISYLEYALAYGRINILKDLLQDEFYTNFLKKENYNPFDLSNCDIYVSTDVHDNSWWGNDEHERMVRNTPNDHNACFELLETEYNKFMNLDNFQDWHTLTFYDIYYSCKYYPELKFLVYRILKQKDKDMSIKNVIEVFKNIMDNKPLLKIITKLFSADEIIPLLNF